MKKRIAMLLCAAMAASLFTGCSSGGNGAEPKEDAAEQGLNPASMNKAVLSIINQAELTSRIQEIVQNTIREELAVLKQLPVQPVQTELEGDDGTDDAIMGFLDNFM